MYVVVGGIIEKDGKVLLVQESNTVCYKKWNIPAGRLDCNETIMEGAIREIKEETGCDVELTGILNVGNKVLENDLWVTVIFATKLINENIQYDENEILDIKWFDIKEVLANMDNELRNLDFIKQPINNLINNNIGPLDIVNVVK